MSLIHCFCQIQTTSSCLVRVQNHCAGSVPDEILSAPSRQVDGLGLAM
ncbi:rCG62491 [Rattus norvegicus]|uniref:RCG62491 n=1 Tax=Rattus norvegicus TaxID=10116 RepID=A6J5V5_RAT|nr:rCG62491 [Rattus norvegicus]